MELRDFVGAVSGSLIPGPDSVLVASSLSRGAFLADYVVIFAGGLYRWNRLTRVKKRKAIQEVQQSMRVYCTFYGARHDPAASKCESCGRSVEAGAGSFCTDCGRPLSTKAHYCAYCGA